MAKVAIRLIGNNSITGAPELSGNYWNISIIGNTDLDLRKAIFPQDKPVRIKNLCLFGKSKILVPEGITVDLVGLKVVGNYKVNVSRSEDEAHHHLKVSHYCLVGDAKVNSK